MIYALFDFTQERWMLLGDYDSELEVVEYLDTLVGSPCFRHDTLAAYRIAVFSADTGCVDTVPRVRIWDYYPADREGVSCRGASSHPEVVPDPQDPPTMCDGQQCCSAEKRGFFSRFNPFKCRGKK